MLLDKKLSLPLLLPKIAHFVQSRVCHLLVIEVELDAVDGKVVLALLNLLHAERGQEREGHAQEHVEQVERVELEAILSDVEDGVASSWILCSYTISNLSEGNELVNVNRAALISVHLNKDSV